MKRTLVLCTMILFAVCSTAQALEILQYYADYGIFGKILKSEDESGIITYTPSINIRNNETKTSVKAWQINQASSTPTLSGVQNGASSWKGTPTTDLKAAYTQMFNETWVVAKAVQVAGKLTAISIGSIVLVDKTGQNTYDLTTETLPTINW